MAVMSIDVLARRVVDDVAGDLGLREGVVDVGLRVLLRVGVAKEGKDYSASYRAVMDAMEHELPSTRNERIALHERLRQHGLNVCKRTKPRCETCSVRSYCAFGPRTS